MKGIYKIVNLINGKVYIGSTNNIQKRKNHHLSCLRNNKHANKYLQRAWNIYDENCFEFSIVEIIEDGNLIEKENYWIKYYNSTDRYVGYNIIQYNENNQKMRIVSEETANKISKSKIGTIFSKDHKMKLSQSHKGLKVSEETKKKISETLKGRVFSEETRKKLSEANKGKKHNEKTKQKLREAGKRQKRNPLSEETKEKIRIANLGKRATEDAKQKMSKSHKGIQNNVKLQHDQIRQIKHMISDGKTGKYIADTFNVSVSTISAIKTGRLWADII